MVFDGGMATQATLDDLSYAFDLCGSFTYLFPTGNTTFYK